MHPYIHSRATYSCQDMKTTSVSINRQIGKAGTALTHTHTMKYLLACLLSHVRLCDPMDCSPPGSSVHGILQARILEWVAMPSSRGSS